ncbi:EF-hand calcium-binding domain-containing protein 6 [Aplochiton taeniatus]
MPLAEIQRRLKSKISSNLRTVIRVFRLFDYNRDGRVQQHEFRRILNNYCFALSEKEFQRLWNHYSPNNMATVAYNDFLEKLGFTSDKNSQFKPNTLMLGLQEVTPPDRATQTTQKKRPNSTTHNASGDTNSVQNLTQDQLQALFLEKLRVSCTPVWQTLQAFDVTQSGLVSTEDMRAVLSSFLFPMSLHTFHMLASRTGADVSSLASTQEGTGRIARADLRQVLEGIQYYLTEPLPAGSTCGQPYTPRPRLSPAQVRELMILLDPEHTGAIPFASLEKLDPRTLLRTPASSPQSEAGFYSRKVNYLKFLKNLGVPVGENRESPFTNNGLNTPEGQHLQSLAGSVSESPELVPESLPGDARIRSVEDIVFRRLRKHLDERRVTVEDRLRATDRSKDGTVTARGLKRLLDDSLIALDEKQFQKLTAQLGFREGKISRSEFLAKYEKNRSRDLDSPQGNHGNTLSKHRLLTAEDCLRFMKDRIKNIHGDIQTAFRVMDKDSDGIVNAHDFRELFNSLGLVAKEREYQRLLALIGLQPGSNLNNSEFHSIIQSNGQFCREQHNPISLGLIFKKGLRYLLYTYDLPLRSDEFEELWSRRVVQMNCQALCGSLRQLDHKNEGLVKVEDLAALLQTYHCFLQRDQLRHILHTLSVPMDREGRRLAYLDFLRVFERDTEKGCEAPPHRPLSAYPAETLERLSTEKVMPFIQKMVTASSDTLRKAFSAFDSNGSGMVTALEFRKVLENLCAPLSDAQFRFLLNKVNLNWEHQAVYWKDFLKQFNPQNQKARTPDQRPDKVVRSASPSRPQSPVCELLGRVWDSVLARLRTITKEMVYLDKGLSNTITKEDFRVLCQRHIMKLSPEQFESVWSNLPVNSRGELAYREFLEPFNAAVQDTISNPEEQIPTNISSPPSQDTTSASVSQRPKTTGSIVQRSVVRWAPTPTCRSIIHTSFPLFH